MVGTYTKGERMMRRFTLIASVVVLVLAAAVPALAGGRPLVADLSWDNEVPPAVDTAATGSAEFRLQPNQGRICFRIATDGLSGDVVADHIHAGSAGENGGVVVDLGGALKGCVDGIDSDLIMAIGRSPASYYLNLHTAINPGGEIRGQLSK
jgi:hypothetical protein